MVPSTHVGQLTTTYNSTAKVSDALSWPLWTPTQRCTYMNMETNTYTEANKKMESNSKALILVVIDLHGSGAKTVEVTADLQFTVYWDQLLQNAQLIFQRRTLQYSECFLPLWRAIFCPSVSELWVAKSSRFKGQLVWFHFD